MTTLEARFDQRLREFSSRRAELPGLERARDAAEASFRALEDAGCRNTDPDAYFAARDALRAAESAVREAHTERDEVEYLLRTAPFIREYATQEAVAEDASGATALDGFVRVTHKSQKSNVFQRYLAAVEGQPADAGRRARTDGSDFRCPSCDAATVFVSRESSMVCPSCGHARAFMEMSEANLTYEQELTQNVVSFFSYKRLNHFCEWLSSLQGRENTEIPQEVVDAVRAEFKKSRATTRADIKPSKVREYLKKLKLQKYYEHCHHICNVLNGVPAPKLPSALEERLKAMFTEIQEPFEKHCPPTRRNFLSYSYVLYKFCELLGEDEYLPYFPLLKSSEKLWAQDCIWRNMCKELCWEFIPSV